MNTVTITAQRVRGYWLTDLGQRVEVWVPAGVYTYGAAEHVANMPETPVDALVGRNGWAWHVPARIVQQLAARR